MGFRRLRKKKVLSFRFARDETGSKIEKYRFILSKFILNQLFTRSRVWLNFIDRKLAKPEMFEKVENRRQTTTVCKKSCRICITCIYVEKIGLLIRQFFLPQSVQT